MLPFHSLREEQLGAGRDAVEVMRVLKPILPSLQRAHSLTSCWGAGREDKQKSGEGQESDPLRGQDHELKAKGGLLKDSNTTDYKCRKRHRSEERDRKSVV